MSSNLEAEVSADVNTLSVARREALAVNDVLLISDGDRTEVVQVTVISPGTGAGTTQVRPNLRFAHLANRNLFTAVFICIEHKISGFEAEGRRQGAGVRF